MTFLVGALLLVVLVGPLALITVQCPDCDGGRVIRMSIGPIPCDLCNDRHHVSALKACGFRINRLVR